MSQSPIGNGKDTPVNVQTGTIPNVNDAMRDWYQDLLFFKITKTTVDFQVIETVDEIPFRGVVQPLTDRDLVIKPEGQRAWTWLQVHADPALRLNVDDIIFYCCVQTRVMARRNYSIYGYVEYELAQDWTGTELLASSYFGGNAFTKCFPVNLFGGEAKNDTDRIEIFGGRASAF